ncbi:MAG: glycine betaine ABC transporter substrate-binding protein [Candidatus Acidiferrales bacterium]
MKFLSSALAFSATVLLLSCGGARRNVIFVGSKNFTEQAILGEIVAQQIEKQTHLAVERRFYLSGTYICHQALLAGRIDVYVEYTGTALTAILKEPVQSDSQAVLGMVRREYESRFKLDVLEPLGFNNAFAMVIRGEDARRLGVQTLSDAARYAPGWRPGAGYEFMERPDGYAGLVRTYGLNFAAQPRIMDLGLLYRALLDRQVDIVAGSATDGMLAARDLLMLQDDRHYFPPYQAVPVVRDETLRAHPEVRAALLALAGQISEADMRRMNFAVEGDHRDTAEVVREFLRAQK